MRRKLARIDIEKLERIPIEDISKRMGIQWDEVFSSIPIGEALVFPIGAPARIVSARDALKRRKQKGKLLNYSVVVSGDNFYIVHSRVDDK